MTTKTQTKNEIVITISEHKKALRKQAKEIFKEIDKMFKRNERLAFEWYNNPETELDSDDLDKAYAKDYEEIKKRFKVK